MSKSIGQFFEGILTAIIGLFHKAEDVASDIFNAADNFVNFVKTSPDAQFILNNLETGAEALFPGFAPAINAIKLWLPNAAAKLSNVEATATTDEAKIQAFLDHLKSLEDNPTLKAGLLGTLNADLQQLLAGVENTSLTPQMSIVAAQAVHDKTLGTGIEV